MSNYFNTLNLRQQLAQLGKCRFMARTEFADGVNALRGKKVVIVGCGAQGLNQGLNMRDSGLDVAYALRAEAIAERRDSYRRATEHGFCVGDYQALIPQADLVINLTPDKQHAAVVSAVQPLMKPGAALGYSHGFNIVEVGQQIRPDITVVMVAPKCPGTEVREEYKRGFGVPTLIAVHPENDPRGAGMAIAKAWASATGGDRAGVLESSFVAEVKSDLMGEQTILCGMLQTGSLLCYERLVAEGADPAWAGKLIQFGWETITEALKQGGITLMMDRLSNPAKLRAYTLAGQLKTLMAPLFAKHMDDILSGAFSQGMMADWAADDAHLLTWRAETGESAFEKAPPFEGKIDEQTYFDRGVLLVAMVKAGVELAFETMVASGIVAESAYYESLHELPLIANTIARRRLYEMNVVISDTAEYGNYLFANAAVPLLRQGFMETLQPGDLGQPLPAEAVDNAALREVNQAIRQHPIETVGERLRGYMTDMKRVAVAG
ncbi:ketol-acid reductoisomerase [Edwardsiella ictaluri]|uniref:Ketol-acid reductoisomerase (NADP(+)) n=1 Tax=Edwardsiella ictaluri (strain 93-146) TaxID=634503 RepID=ILVC_EDWI9|nr:ketol-acid reductoisomerase [Edwardsiella ictaluri]C5BBA8.1 RecName: Full=Ketol-acid reductoisomerase (NADP(+)); Short=KARI; AltName: Full=Acetohydroxy-acid isomeroreductase; Short=AHIR; AltName: Full=Alpha-keto-beta-hydroxylacyl reductoisomerase; AltName: Full=Ketol-acid reductoisomerase type 2; AltName: Full=Ketol-acid reductoisomerase type II [Edwardsiella ictaluri 93-146]ACR67343.1 ketol-acid reductoisomerase, putative [Edwardsiella ictaluri 93-146]AVZ82144.1 ketol-acid reductoisomerase [